MYVTRETRQICPLPSEIIHQFEGMTSLDSPKSPLNSYNVEYFVGEGRTPSVHRHYCYVQYHSGQERQTAFLKTNNPSRPVDPGRHLNATGCFHWRLSVLSTHFQFLPVWEQVCNLHSDVLHGSYRMAIQLLMSLLPLHVQWKLDTETTKLCHLCPAACPHRTVP